MWFYHKSWNAHNINPELSLFWACFAVELGRDASRILSIISETVGVLFRSEEPEAPLSDSLLDSTV